MRFYVMGFIWSVCVAAMLAPLHLPIASFIGACGLSGAIFAMLYKIGHQSDN
jgi:uncharacterized membrane protein AbrB (regulator of aidB expression)